MSEVIDPGWSVDAIERSAHGTDLAAILTGSSDRGARRAVLNATAADFVAVPSFDSLSRIAGTHIARSRWLVY